AAAVPHGVVALDGPLGAGKTRLVQAGGAGCGGDERGGVSPPFVLVHENDGARPIIHIDAYPLPGENEVLEVGAEEYFAPPNLVLVEWASRVARCLPAERLEIAIRVLSDHQREFAITGYGADMAAAVERVQGTAGS